MPERTACSERQRGFFAAISQVNLLVLAIRERPKDDAASINAHGRFYLFDKYWPRENKRKHETLIAFSPSTSIALTDTTEPLVHVHVDWRQLKWAQVRERPMTLIGADKEIVLCREQDPNSRVIWFYFWRWEDIEPLKDFGRDWIDLEPPVA